MCILARRIILRRPSHSVDDGADLASYLCFAFAFCVVLIVHRVQQGNSTMSPCPGWCLQLLTNLATQFKTRPFSYFWAEGAQQPALEANVGVGG